MRLNILKFPDRKRIAVIKVVRQLTGLNLVDAKTLVDRTPHCIIYAQPGADLRASCKELDELGATYAQTHGERLRIKAGWGEAGQKCQRVAMDAYVGGQYWTPVLWDGEEDPSWHKASGLEPIKEQSGGSC